MMKMVDVSNKPHVAREAKAVGRIRLRPRTIDRIVKGEVEKGDVFTAAKLSAVMAAKKTSEIIPLCHQIPLTNVGLEVKVEGSSIVVEAMVRSVSQTGVEMEALTAAAVALLTIWDFVKQYEKDSLGQYPETVIEEIRVVEKVKGGIGF